MKEIPDDIAATIAMRLADYKPVYWVYRSSTYQDECTAYDAEYDDTVVDVRKRCVLKWSEDHGTHDKDMDLIWMRAGCTFPNPFHPSTCSDGDEWADEYWQEEGPRRVLEELRFRQAEKETTSQGAHSERPTT